MGAFRMGLRFVGVLAGLLIFVGTSCGGAGKLCISTELVDSVDLRFFCRVGAIAYFGMGCWKWWGVSELLFWYLL